MIAHPMSNLLSLREWSLFVSNMTLLFTIFSLVTSFILLSEHEIVYCGPTWKKKKIWHKSILIVHLIELCDKISDIYAEPWRSSKSENKWGGEPHFGRKIELHTRGLYCCETREE